MTKGETTVATFSVRKVRYVGNRSEDETLDKFWYFNFIANFMEQIYISST